MDNPLFTLSPTAPLYNAPAEDEISVRAFVNFRNVHLLAFGGAGSTHPALAQLAAQNRVYFSSSSAAPMSEDSDQIENWERSSLIEISTLLGQSQMPRRILLKVHLHALDSGGRVRVAINRRIQETCPIPQGPDFMLPILIPPPQDWVYVDIKHIQTDDGKAAALLVGEIQGFLV